MDLLQSEMAKDPVIKICETSCFFLRLSLVWPNKKNQLNPPNIFFLRLAVFLVIVIFSFVLPIFLHLVKSIQEGGIDISEDLSMLASVSGMLIIITMYGIKQRDIARLLKDLSDFEKIGEPPLFHNVNKRLNNLSKFVGSYVFAAEIFYNLWKIRQISECKKTSKIGEVCGVIVPMWAPFNFGKYLGAYIFYVFVVVMIISRVHLMVSCQVLEIAYNIKLRLDHLNSMIIKSLDDEKTGRTLLNNCIRYHHYIIECSERFNCCFTNKMFVYLSIGGFICGCVENQIAKQLNILGIVHILGWIAALFAPCFGGQILMDSSTSVRDAAYNSKWYERRPYMAKDLILVIMRSQKPMIISTGGFNVLSYSLFVSIMKMSYSILTLLNA